MERGWMRGIGEAADCKKEEKGQFYTDECVISAFKSERDLRVLKNYFLSVVGIDFKARIVVELESLRLRF